MVISGLLNTSVSQTSSPDTNNYKVINLDTTLTADDKRIVKAATGSDIGQGKQVPALADAIAISRSLGTLKGPVTASFLQKYSSDPQIGATTINKALSFLNDEAFPQRSGDSGSLDLVA